MFFAAAVDVERVVGRGRQVFALAAKTHPAVEAGLGLVALAAHVPLAKKSRGEAGALEILREVNGAGGNGAVVVDDAVAKGVEAGENGGAAGRAEGGGDEGVFDVDAVAREGVEVGRLGDGMAHEAHRIVAVVVGEDEDDVLRFGAGDALGDDLGGDGDNGGAEGARDDEGEEEG